GQLHNLRSVGRHELPRPARRLTARVGFEFVTAAIVQQRFGPGLERRLGVGQTATAGAPDTFFLRRCAQPNTAIGPSWRRFCRTRLRAAPPAPALSTGAGLALALSLRRRLLSLLALCLQERS